MTKRSGQSEIRRATAAEDRQSRPDILREGSQYGEAVSQLARRATMLGYAISPSDEPARPVWKTFSAGLRLTQGWKFHLTIDGEQALSLLQIVGPFLLDKHETFKVCPSLREIYRVNNGEVGFTQVGKVWTIYPADGVGLSLASDLFEITRGFLGPEIPSDRRFGSHGVLYYRFGAYGDTYAQSEIGEVRTVVIGPRGELTTDERTMDGQHHPAWVSDPFVSDHGASDEATPASIRPGTIIDDRFMILQRLSPAPRIQTWSALDRITLRPAVLKVTVFPDRQVGTGQSALDLLDREASALDLLDALACVPRLVARVDSDCLRGHALEFVKAERLDSHCQSRWSERSMTRGVGLDLALSITAAVADIHALGIHHGDINSANILVSPADGTTHLVDFEFASGPDTPPDELSGGHTRGYRPRSHLASKGAEADVYGVGACLYLIFTGAEPSLAPDASSLLSRMPEDLNPAIGDDLSRIIVRALRCFEAPYAIAELHADLLSAESVGEAGTGRADFQTEIVRFVDQQTEDGLPALRSSIRDWAHSNLSRIATEIDEACRAADDPLPDILSPSHPANAGTFTRDLNSGLAGIVLTLATLEAHLGTGHLVDALSRASSALLTCAGPIGGAPSGLYVGEAGIAFALLRAGSVLESQALMDSAVERCKWALSRPCRSPDLFNGHAGRIRVAGLFAEHEPEWFASYVSEGCAALVEAASRGDGGDIWWRFPEEIVEFSEGRYLGYSHGTAGIADVLLSSVQLLGRGASLPTPLADDVASVVGDAALVLGRTALELTPGLAEWPTTMESESPIAPMWCHGSAGILIFLARVSASDQAAHDDGLLSRCIRAVRVQGRGLSAVYCHGQAGNIEALLDAHLLTGSNEAMSAALDLAAILRGHFFEGSDGRLCVPSDEPDELSLEFMVAMGGAISCLVRLAGEHEKPGPFSLPGAVA